MPVAAVPLLAALVLVVVVGLMLGPLVNWAIYNLAWTPRNISPWGPTPQQAPPRRPSDRIPVFGWWRLRREAAIHGRGFWIRPLLIELAMPLGLGALYWWEVDQQGLIAEQVRTLLRQAGLGPVLAVPALFPSTLPLASLFVHGVLLVLMTSASFIDIDEKIIPDEITVPGTLLGLLLATFVPLALLPNIAVRNAAPPVGIAAAMAAPPGGAAIYAEPTTATAPNQWPEQLDGAPNISSLVVGLACWALWCFALAPRIWRGRHGPARAVTLITRRVLRELTRPPLGVIALAGLLFILAVWFWGGGPWLGLLTSLLGMTGCGLLVWIVRIVGTAALRREAMGFGDVTLMMMIGTYVGWQAGVWIFFLAPFAGLVIGILQAVLRRDDEIPYGPFLCLATLFVIVFWGHIWSGSQMAFDIPLFVPAVLAVCFALMFILLFIWQQLKTWLLRRGG